MKQYEKLLYQSNTAPYWLAMLFLVFNTYQTIITLNMIDIVTAGILTAEIILLNILLSFLVFIVASEIKRYNLRWAYFGIGTGAFQCLRTLFVSTTISRVMRIHIIVSLLMAGFFLLTAALISMNRSKKRAFAAKG
ncbi:MAG: hypothetical protein LBT13_09220 [Treponema sp.]|jgi:bacteriorhodopsin|nr:hypothetical protein [Treponema sp.]